jgi:hypothetical protein
MGPVAAELYGRPADGMTLVGVTGTSGKTTVTYLLEAIFERSGRPAGVIGTTGAGGRPPVPPPALRRSSTHRPLADWRSAGSGKHEVAVRAGPARVGGVSSRSPF